MELDNVGHSVAVVHRLFVGEVEVDGDAEVGAGDDDRRNGEVEGEQEDDEREALVLHLAPGEGAGQAEGLGTVPPPAQDGEQSPDQSVQPDPQAQDLYLLPANCFLCRGKMKGRLDKWCFI